MSPWWWTLGWGRIGSMRRRDGFTFIEMLMVFILIALLAGVVGVQVSSFRARAITTTLKSDLRNLAVAQESFYYDYDVYAPDTTTLYSRGYQVTTGTQMEINEATIAGWAATASHPQTPERCYLFIPGASPIGVATQPGRVQCG